MKFRSAISIVSLTTVILFAGSFNSQPSSGQQQFPPTNRKPACGCYVCGKLLAVDFPNKAKDCYGILATDACPVELAKMPDKGRAACQAIKKSSKDGSLNGCQALAQYCDSLSEQPPKEEPPEKNCEKPTPWFGTPPSGCKDVQSPVAAINAGAVTLSICGSPVFRWADKDPLALEAYREVVMGWVKERIGSKVCCDTFREAARTGIPCYPGADVDCDGKSNQDDGFVHLVEEKPAYTLPAINRPFSIPEGFGESVAPFPPGLDPDDAEFFPPQEKCDCKWELVKGTLKCSPDGKQPHSYQARWRCPSTGNERFTRKEAPPTAPCK